MREIKFRAYLKDRMKIVDVIMLEPENKIRYEDDDVICECDIDECELMQFTGLYDKSGKEIYEGDIIKLGNGQVRFVFYEISEFKHIAYGKVSKNFDYTDKGYEVIGNIFDNNELLGE